MQIQKVIKVALIGAIAAAALVLSPVSHADESSASLTDDQLVRIRTSCSQIQTQLRRVHSSDALLRVNRGQLYEHMGTRLMTPLNTRIAASRLDGSNLITITSQYETHLRQFREAYQRYERQMSSTININCRNQPARFYEALVFTRELRREVHQATILLANDVNNYDQAFQEFITDYREGGGSL